MAEPFLQVATQAPHPTQAAASMLSSALSCGIRILFALFESEMCVCDNATTLDMTQSAVSHQLKILKQAKLIDFRREGKSVIYKLADAHVSSIIAQGMEHIRE